MEKQGIVFTYVKEESTEELDFLLRHKILGKNWDDEEKKEYPYLTYNNEKTWSRETTPVPIDYVIDILNKLKNKGANYVEIMYHGDHIEYVFNGIEIHKMSKNEIAEYENKMKLIEEENKKNEIAELERKLEFLKK